MLRVRVEDMDGGEGETYAFLRSPIRVGRGALNDLRLDRPYVSTWHGLIQFDDDGIRFVDLGSTNGTFLDGVRLERNAPATITPARELTIGRLRLVLSRGGKSEVRKAQAEPVTHFALRVAEDVAAASMVDIKAAAAAAVGAVPRPEDTGATGGLSFPALPADLPPLDLGVVAPPPPADLGAPPAAVLPPVDAGPPDPEVERVLQDASWQLGVLHDACQRAAEDFRVAFEQATTSLGESQRERARALAAERYPHAFAGVPAPVAAAVAPVAVPPVAVAPVAAPHLDADAAAFAASFPQAAVAPAAVAPAAVQPAPALGGELRDEALRLVRAFATAYISAEAAPTTPAALERFLGALAEALETAARGYLELRGGYEQFGREMGIRVPSSDGVLGRIADVRQLVGWLLQPGDGESRPRQLAGAFADLMIHQVALLNGVQAGARELLDELSPDAVEKATSAGGLGLKALREAALWRTFTERHQELASEESAVTAVLFGQAFARAYTAVAGRRTPTGDANPSPAPASRKTRRRDQE